MWKCKVCGAEVEDDSWQECWNCSNDKELADEKTKTAKDDFQKYLHKKQEIAKNLECVRCGSNLLFLGTRRLHEGPKLGFWFGNLGEVFVNRVSLDQFYCQNCGKVEFFLEGIKDHN
jgi:predicted RNA-binding Zn-ribbon protein involved in translation (DUF1610 family)